MGGFSQRLERELTIDSQNDKPKDITLPCYKVALRHSAKNFSPADEKRPAAQPQIISLEEFES